MRQGREGKPQGVIEQVSSRFLAVKTPRHELLLRLCGLQHTDRQLRGKKKPSGKEAFVDSRKPGRYSGRTQGAIGQAPGSATDAFYLAERAGCFRSWETLVFMSGVTQVNNGDNLDRHGPGK